MAERVLTQRELNRTLLSRQLLLQRSDLPIPETVEGLIGLQAQVPNPPYIGLWTRLHNFRRDDLTRLIEARQIVRAALMRSTLHLVTAEDHQRVQPTIAPALARALNAFYGQRARGLDIAALVTAARPFLTEQPRSTGELSNHLLKTAPDRDPSALAYAVRSYLPLLQVPPSGTWGSGSATTYVPADLWLGPPEPPNLGGLLRRYLAAFGPASVMDFQAWTGMTKLKDALAPLTADLVVYRSEGGKALLYDLPELEILSGDTPAPVRFIPMFDNLILAHADRTRVISEEARRRVFLSAGRVLATILVDGFVRGIWKVERAKQSATLIIEPFEPLNEADRVALTDEGERLIRFIEADAEDYAVQFTDQS
ncbi:MAG: winged helix DNA-binding domain-containing protein [Chloroflexi bacterium]|nr:winged helix DNA-binding domain-containing protein [Chloroflexota bacterium]